MTDGRSDRIQLAFSPGDRVLTRTRKPFVIEEVGEQRIRFRLSEGHTKMSLRQSTLAHVIDNFEEIRDSANIEHAINAVLKRFKDQDTANESYLYGLARDFLDGQPKRAATTSRGSIPKRLMLAKERKKALEELAFNPQNEKDAREWVEALIAVRQRQPEFRRMLLDAYDSRCAISGCDCS